MPNSSARRTSSAAPIAASRPSPVPAMSMARSHGPSCAAWSKGPNWPHANSDNTVETTSLENLEREQAMTFIRIASGVLLAAALGIASASAEPVKLIFATIAPADSLAAKGLIHPFADRINEAGKDVVQID